MNLKEIEKEFEKIWYTQNKDKPVKGWEGMYNKLEPNFEHDGDVGKLVEESKRFIKNTVIKEVLKEVYKKFGDYSIDTYNTDPEEAKILHEDLKKLAKNKYNIDL
jgi:hypothetical protein